MNSRHWTNDELLDHVYGLKSSDEHLSSCDECATRRDRLERIRGDVTRPPEIPEALLAAQRRSIYQRLGSPIRAWHPMRWAVSIIAMFFAAIALTVYQPRSPLRSYDDQFYAELSSLAQDPAPRAVQPIEALVADDIEP